MQRNVFLFIMFSFLLSGCVSSPTSASHSPETIPRTVYNHARQMYANMDVRPRMVALGVGGGLLASSVVSGMSLPMGMAVGAVAGGALGHYLYEHQSELERLQHHGVNVMWLGDEVRVAVPGYLVFDGCGELSNPRILQDIAKFLKPITKEMVTVDAFSYRFASAQQNEAFSKREAEAVSYYLRDRINSPIVVARGRGTGLRKTAMSHFALPEDDRIEISFQAMHT